MGDVRGFKLVRAFVGRAHRQALTQYIELWEKEPEPVASAADGIIRQASEESLRTAPEHWMAATDAPWRQIALETTHQYVQRRAVLTTVIWTVGLVLLPAALYFGWWAVFESESIRMGTLATLVLCVTAQFFTAGTLVLKPAANAAMLQSARLAKWQRDGQPR